MKHAVLRSIAPVMAAMLLAACADSVPTDAAPEDPAFASVPGTPCPLTAGMVNDVKAWFPEPERTPASKVMSALKTACSKGDPSREQHALDLLRGIEYILDLGRGGNAVIGSRLTNALLACISSVNCDPAAVPGIDFVGALSPGGLFAVRFGDSRAPAIARNDLPFIDFASHQNAARFGVEINQGTSWAAANQSKIVLLYGRPLVEGGLDLKETGIGGLQYEFNRWPKLGPFASDNLVHVGVCFREEIELPDDPVTGASAQPRMQRESTLLSPREPTFCSSATNLQKASVLGPLGSLARSLLSSAGIAMFGVKTPAIGGSALDFSRFAPVAANPNGSAQFLKGPPSVVKPNASLGPITIRVATGRGTGIERARVTVYIKQNKGVPAGAVLSGNPTGFTDEASGTVVIDGLRIAKPGGYTLCARAELDGFSFEVGCAPMFHVKK